MTVRDLVLQPAQRYSVLVTADADADVGGKEEGYWIRSRMVEDKFAYDKCVSRFFGSLFFVNPTEKC